MTVAEHTTAAAVENLARDTGRSRFPVTAMRAAHAQLALVTDDHRQVIGIAALEDLLEQLIGDFDDETDIRR